LKTALITGVSGQDGAYLASFLIKKGYQVIGTVRSYRSINTRSLDLIKITDKIILEELDLLDMANVISILNKYNPDEVYNLAAQSSVGLSFAQPLGTFSFNTISVNNLLEAIRLFHPKLKLYQASSSEMFGHVLKLPIDMDTPMKPASPYGVSKMASHFMISTYRNAYNLFICSGILFNHESILRSKIFFIKKVIIESLNIKYGSRKNYSWKS
jgi:GDPmannose 4,6-dehydratase